MAIERVFLVCCVFLRCSRRKAYWFFNTMEKFDCRPICWVVLREGSSFVAEKEKVDFD
jgi:hypothetical protein